MYDEAKITMVQGRSGRNRGKTSKVQKEARAALARNLLLLTSDNWLSSAVREAVPEAWHRLEQDLPVEERKVKVTLYLDQSVARFYKAMGKGYQARINRLLATWAQMKIAEELQVDAALSVTQNAHETEERHTDKCVYS